MQRLIGVMEAPAFVPLGDPLLRKRHCTQKQQAWAKRYSAKLAGIEFDSAFAPMARPFSEPAAIIAGYGSDIDVDHMEQFYFDPNTERGSILEGLEKKYGVTSLGTYLKDPNGLFVTAFANEFWRALKERVKETYKDEQEERTKNILLVGPSVLVASLGFVAAGGPKNPLSQKLRLFDPGRTQCYEILFDENGAPALTTLLPLH